MRYTNRSAERRFRDNLVDELWAFGQRRGFLLPPHGVAADEDRIYDKPSCQSFVRELFHLTDHLPDPNDFPEAEDFLAKVRDMLGRCRSEAWREMPAEEMVEMTRTAREGVQPRR